MSETIDILLATYNGARFVREQLDSLAAQTHRDWRLLVRDDGSTDDTMAIVRAWAEACDRPVEIIEDGRKGLGASQNFGALLEKSTAPYFAFCDQDDVWLPEKLEVMLAAMRAEEAEVGDATPVMMFCDLEVVDENLVQIAASFWGLSRIKTQPKYLRPEQVMLRNPLTGCASMGNAALRQIGTPVPAGSRMHDWWLAMVAAYFGRLLPIARLFVKYRQHGGNAIGATNLNGWWMVRDFITRPRSALKRAVAVRDSSQLQALTFSRRFQLSNIPTDSIVKYSQLNRLSLINRKFFILKRVMSASFGYYLALLFVS